MTLSILLQAEPIFTKLADNGPAFAIMVIVIIFFYKQFNVHQERTFKKMDEMNNELRELNKKHTEELESGLLNSHELIAKNTEVISRNTEAVNGVGKALDNVCEQQRKIFSLLSNKFTNL